jgi:broad specificity phosphatase PhoE
MTRVTLVRHGRTEWNRVERFRGRADLPLDETGMAQARATARRLAAGPPPQAVYSSPLSRARQTAEAIAAAFGLPVRVQEALADIDYGQWQGLTPAQVKERWPGLYEEWLQAPQRARIPGGESLRRLRRRAMAGVTELCRRHDGGAVVLVAHTVVNRIILLGILGLGNERFWRLHQDPCALNVFEWEAGRFTLVSLNDTCHLRG